MDIKFELGDLLYLITGIVGFIVAAILIAFKNRKFSRYNHLLGISFAFLSLAMFIGLLINTGLITRIPFLYRYGNLFVLLCMPFSYLYVRGVISEMGPGRKDLILFLPTLFYLVDYFPILILPGSEKMALYDAGAAREGSHLSFHEGWLTPPYFHLFFRHVVMVIFWAMQLRMLLKIHRSTTFLTDNKYWFYWIWAYQWHQVLYFLPFFIYLISPKIMAIISYSEVFAIGSLFLLYMYLFYRPVVLYGISGILDQSGQAGQSLQPGDDPDYVSGSELMLITGQLDKLMQGRKPYLKPDYSIDAMARDIDVSPWLLSAVLNKGLGTNFNRYINRYRILHCLDLLEDGAYQTMSIEGIARECGFNNRNSFTQSFKLHQKMTPSAYIRARYSD